MNITYTNFTCQLLDRDEFENQTDIYKSSVHMYTTSKRIELESPGFSGFEADLGSFKTLASGTFQLNLFRSCVHMNPMLTIRLLTCQRKYVGLVFTCTQLLNELSQRVPVAQVLKLFKFASKPEQLGLSSSIRLEVVYI